MNTLFLLMSIDGKISTGSSHLRDFDIDLSGLAGIQQYYDIEQTTDLVTFISGKTLEKIGTNSKKWSMPRKENLTIIVVDNKPHLTMDGVSYLSNQYGKVVIATTNRIYLQNAKHFEDNVEIRWYSFDKIDFKDLFSEFENITIQSGGELNSYLLRNGFIDKVKIVIAPILIGGRATPTIMDGDELITEDDLKKIVKLELTGSRILSDSFILFDYDVL